MANVTDVIQRAEREDAWSEQARIYTEYVRNTRGIRVHGSTGSVHNLPVTREYAMNIAWHMVAAGRFGRNNVFNEDVYRTGFIPRFPQDAWDVHPHVREAVYELVYYGIVDGRIENNVRLIAPNENLTRAELCKIFALCIATEIARV
jgi:hypothetical protein